MEGYVPPEAQCTAMLGLEVDDDGLEERLGSYAKWDESMKSAER